MFRLCFVRCLFVACQVGIGGSVVVACDICFALAQTVDLYVGVLLAIYAFCTCAIYISLYLAHTCAFVCVLLCCALGGCELVERWKYRVELTE
jgi:hypothetical protein